MKKLLFTLVALAMSIVTMAGNFVMLPYSGRAELEKHFSDPNLTVHFYTDTEVFATAERFESSRMVMLDENAFARKCLMNIASCAFFSSDRTIRDYAENIWHIEKLPPLPDRD